MGNPSASADVDRPRRRLALLLVVAAGVVAFHNSFQGSFVFDDQGAIVDNPTIRQLWPPNDVLSPPIEGLPVTGRPVTNLSLAVNYALHGLQPFGYHLFNLLVHLACAAALFGLVRRTAIADAETARSHALIVATVIAALWVVHPLTTGGVTYISQRAEAMASALVVFALYAFARSRTSPRPLPWLSAVVGCAWLGIAVKEFAAAIPLLVALYHRLFAETSWRRVFTVRPWFYPALAASWIPLCLLIASTQNRGGTWAADSGFAPLEYLLIQAQAVPHYLRLVFWPQPLIFDYGRNIPVPSIGETLLPGLFVLTLLIGAVLTHRRYPALSFCGAVFFLILAPTSSFVPIADPIFEHRMYLPSAAVITAIVLVSYRFLHARVWMMATPLLFLLILATLHRNQLYASALTLWADTVAKRPVNARAQGNLGKELVAAGEPQRALEHFAAAHHLTPTEPVAVHNYAVGLAAVGRVDEAIERYHQALQLKPENHLARTALGKLLAQKGELSEAAEHLRRAVADAPRFFDARVAYGQVLLRQNEPAAALEHFRAAAELRPDDSSAYFNLGDALARSGNMTDAVAAFREARRLRPEDAAVLNNLGNALLLSRDVPGAIDAFEAALRVEPSALTHTNLGLAYLLAQRRADAQAQFAAALRLDPGHAPARSALRRLGVTP